MLQVFSSNDPASIAYASSLIASKGIPFYELDVHTSFLEGSIGIIPRRICVPKYAYEEAVEILELAGLYGND